MLTPEKFQSLNQRMPGVEVVDLLDDNGEVVATEVSAERRPITKKSVFNIVQIQSNSLEWVLHDNGTLGDGPRDGMTIRADDGDYTIQSEGVVSRMLNTRHHCLCVKQRGVS